MSKSSQPHKRQKTTIEVSLPPTQVNTAQDILSKAADDMLPTQPAQPSEGISQSLPLEPPIGGRWGEFPPKERQNELEHILHAWEQETCHEECPGPFAKQHLTGADVFWLAAHVAGKGNLTVGVFWLPPWNTSFVRRSLDDLNLKAADLRHAQLQGASLRCAQLHEADLSEAQLQGADCIYIHLEGAKLVQAQLQEANLYHAYLEKADLLSAQMQQIKLEQAQLVKASLFRSQLQGAKLWGAHLEGTDLSFANLDGADLRRTTLNMKTLLIETLLSNHTRMADVHWNNALLTDINWEPVTHVGEESIAHELLDWDLFKDGRRKDSTQRLHEYHKAATAYRQLATALRNQGLSDEANRFLYRAQVLQRQLFWRQFMGAPISPKDASNSVIPLSSISWMRVWLKGLGQKIRKFSSYLFSLFLAAIAGYGYRPGRSVSTYLLIIFGFMGLYLLNSSFATPHLTWDQALVLSVSSFHGRGFFEQDITLGSTYARLAAAEAVVGLLIEISFIATFTQRFFSR